MKISVRRLILALLAVPVALALVTASTGARAATVLITGANQGIGLEFAKEYAARGWTVIATHRRPTTPEELAKLAAAYPRFASSGWTSPIPPRSRRSRPGSRAFPSMSC